MENKKQLQQLLTPQTIAIVGASNKAHKVGHLLVKNTTSYGYRGDVFYVNHSAKKIAGKKVYRSITDIGQQIDVAIIAIPGPFVYDVIREALPQCKNFVVISAGFGEGDLAGHNREMQLYALAKKHHLMIIGPNCLGFLSPRIALNASFAPGLPPVGDTAFISQSGALAVALIDRATSLDIGFSYIVSIGNKMQISEVELLFMLADDQYTKTIILYLESIVGGQRFMQAVLHARARGKRVIILKSGKTDDAQKAISLHTGSLTSGDHITQAVFTKVGVLRADTIDEIFTYAATAHLLPRHKKTPRIAIITNAGGPGVIATDIIAQSDNLYRASLTAQTQKILQHALPPSASTHNPIDLLGDALVDRYEIALTTCIADTHTDMIFVLLTPQDQTPVDAIAKMIVRLQRETSKPIITSFIGGTSVHTAQQILRTGDVLHADTPSTILHAVDAIVHHDMMERYTLPHYTPTPNERAQKILTHTLKDHAKGFYFTEAKTFLSAYHIPVSSVWDITDGLGTKAPVRYPAVVKVDDPQILHKSDRGGVILPIVNAVALHKARKTLLKRFDATTTRIIAQPLQPIQMELIIGMKRDPLFGTVVLVGLGGIYTEIFHKTEIFIAPFGVRELKKRLRHGVLHFLFDGTRNQKPYDLSAVVQTVLALQDIAANHQEISTIDLNPFLLYNNAKRSQAVDVKIILS